MWESECTGRSSNKKRHVMVKDIAISLCLFLLLGLDQTLDEFCLFYQKGAHDPGISQKLVSKEVAKGDG
jgi:hypothetical protein